MLLPLRDRHPLTADLVFIAAGATVIGDVIIGEQVGIWFNIFNID